MSEYARQWLDWADDNGLEVGQWQKDVINRIIETGEVKVSDYETALSGYRQCMLDKGYKEIIFTDIGGGLKLEAAHKSGTDAQEQKYATDYAACSDYHSTGISHLYEKQIGNPQLYKDFNEAMADCLRRKGLVDASYTAKQFAKEREESDRLATSGKADESWTYSFPEDSPDGNQCRVSNGWISSKAGDPVETLW